MSRTCGRKQARCDSKPTKKPVKKPIKSNKSIAGPSKLASLPTELVLNICRSLRLEDEMSLFLTGPDMAIRIGFDDVKKHLEQDIDRTQRARVLTHLGFASTKAPCKYVCWKCGALHRFGAAGLPGSAGPRLEDPVCIDRCLSKTAIALHRQAIKFDIASDAEIRFEHVQEVMKRWRSESQSGIQPNDFSFSEMRQIEVENRTCKAFCLLHNEARIESGELLLRSQRWLYTSWAIAPKTFARFYRSGQVQDFINGSTMAMEIEGEALRPSWNRNRFSETKVETIRPHLHHLACVSTTWMNLGDGTDPFSPKWKNHCIDSASLNCRFKPESIQARFEGLPGPKQEDITRDNLAYLSKANNNNTWPERQVRVSDKDVWKTVQPSVLRPRVVLQVTASES